MINTDNINNTINANKHNPEVVTDNISDGFHTFGQLYFQRMMLFATLVNLFPELSWKTERHEDGELCFGGGWFLVTIDTPVGAYGYHYEMEYWDKFNCPVLKKAKHWDGYTEENVDRLFSLIDVKDWYSLILDKNALKKRDETIAQWQTNQFPKQDML
jgi:hypothetical protein